MRHITIYSRIEHAPSVRQREFGEAETAGHLGIRRCLEYRNVIGNGL